MTKALLILIGAVYWLILHRVVYIYMGEATLVVMLTGFGWYVWRKHREANWGPNFYNDNREVWTGWHVICFMSGSIVLPGLVRFIA